MNDFLFYVMMAILATVLIFILALIVLVLLNKHEWSERMVKLVICSAFFFVGFALSSIIQVADRDELRHENKLLKIIIETDSIMMRHEERGKRSKQLSPRRDPNHHYDDDMFIMPPSMR